MRFVCLPLMVAVFGLISCGGGGGDPGQCTGSPEWCAQTGGTGSGPSLAPAVPALPPVSAPVGVVSVLTAVCADMTSLDMALLYLRLGAAQLDADSDGKPCENEFPQ